MAKNKPKKIWIDADACPKAVKEMAYKASRRLAMPVILVANAYQFTPSTELIQLIIVDKGEDVADQYIIDQVEAYDLVITADIPLAVKIVEKKAVGLNPRGEIYTERNIGGISSMRNFMKDLREGGEMTGGPPPFRAKDLQKFANSLNQVLS